MKCTHRSYKKILKSDLNELGRIAQNDLKAFFERNSYLGRLYANRLIAIALCQGAALHFIDGTTGVKDFDVWCFFRAHQKKPFPCRRNVSRDFGNPKFGKSPNRQDFIGRRVDLLGRSIEVPKKTAEIDAVIGYLKNSKTVTARHLSQKAVVMLWPPKYAGRVIWPLVR